MRKQGTLYMHVKVLIYVFRKYVIHTSFCVLEQVDLSQANTILWTPTSQLFRNMRILWTRWYFVLFCFLCCAFRAVTITSLNHMWGLYLFVCLYPILQIQAANTILVVGGGTTGVEMAAEVKTEFPKKKVAACWCWWYDVVIIRYQSCLTACFFP